ncbi:probable membrane-associated kinase regulator 6 [Phalaenopsis equestris]|uniref:probable membrane-associated kinase regulator 6 n=1 Tax=Phalaenopsis equestris TaxID=78828 RepID=UPI0009E2F572|nr:probable membrane-associated kinase regulator 6 [Phalaenopsis equestris]
MESINQISIESFSHGWLTNINSPFDFDSLEDSLRRSFDAIDSTSFIEMDPDFFSMRWIDSTSFDFTLPSSSEPSNLVHADQIFSNGQLLPSTPLKKNEPHFSPDSALNRTFSIGSSKKLFPEINHWDESISANASPTHKNRKTSPGKRLRKYLNFLIPLYKKVKKLKMMMSLRAIRSCGDSLIRSVRMKNEFSSMERNRGGRVNRVFDLEFECSIHDAILHCKKSFANFSKED